ncbi:hypothetical protein P7C73_g5023, partial [Tremellales sp. Uapishka_1]
MPSPLDQPEIPTPSHTPIPSTPAEPAPHKPLAIEAPSTSAATSPEDPVHILNVTEGNVIKLDKLGPMIINSDGNWQDLSTIEQERTVRLLVKKRNLVRLQSLASGDKRESEEAMSALVGGES